MSYLVENRIIRRLLAVLLCGLLTVCAAVPVLAEGELTLASEAAVLMDAQTGQVLYEKNMDRRMYPASITKVMTALLALRELEPEQLLTVSQAAVNAVPRTSSHISLVPGETLTVEQAMYAIGMESANDAANVLAEEIGGSLSAFADAMTQEARALGAKDTHFTNANGLPDSQHYTTAYDMALITAAALKEPRFAEYFSTVNYTLPATNMSGPRTFSNKDRLLPGGQYAYDGVVMAKTGWTTSAQGTFAAAVQRGDTTLIVITLKSPLLEDKYRDTWTLLNYGFSRYARTAVSGEKVAEQLSLGDFVPSAGQAFTFQLPTDYDFSELSFTLAEGTALPEDAEQATVTVMASIGDLTLPNAALVLEHLPQEAEPKAAPSEEAEAPQTEPEAEAPHRSVTVYIVIGVVLVLFLFVRFRRFRRRRSRRRVLEARIRQMKKQME